MVANNQVWVAGAKLKTKETGDELDEGRGTSSVAGGVWRRRQTAIVESDATIARRIEKVLRRAGARDVRIYATVRAASRVQNLDQLGAVIIEAAAISRSQPRHIRLLTEIHQQALLIALLDTIHLADALKSIDLCDGLVFVDRNLSELPAILDLAEAGYCLLPDEIVRVMLISQPRLDLLETLTTEERRVLELIGEGISNREIAVRLRIGEDRTKNLTRTMMRKMCFRNRTEAAVFATRHQIARGGAYRH